MAATATELFRDLSLLLSVAVVSHFLIRRFRQPTIIGEIGVGIVLGPTVVGAFGVTLFDQTLLESFAALGAIVLLFLVGLESDFRSVYTRKNFVVALGGVMLPLVLGFTVAYVMVPAAGPGPNGTPFTMAAFVGAAMVATSTAIAAAILLELGLMKERIAQTIMGAAVVDDILGLLVLSIVVGSSRPGGVDVVGVALLTASAVAFVGGAILFGTYFFSPIVVRLQDAGARLGMRHGGFSVAMAITFMYAFVADLIGLSAIVGAFLAGSMFASTPLREEFEEGARFLGAVFTPIFFISMGLLVNLGESAKVPQFFAFALVLIAVAIVAKLAGCAIPARLTKMTARESIAVGWGMTPRGEVGLIVALTALTAGIIEEGLFSVIVLVMIVVSILPTPFFKRALEWVAAERAKADSQTLAPETSGPD